MSKCFHPNYEALLAAFRSVQAALARVAPTSGGTTGTPPGVVEFPHVIEDTGESYLLKSVEQALSDIEEFGVGNPTYYQRFARVHFLLCPMPSSVESKPRIEGPDFGTLEQTDLWQAWDDASGGSSVDLDELTTAVETLRDELARLKRWKESAGRKARRFGT